MSELQHTPGPWRHHYDKYDGDSIQANQKPIQFVVRRFQDPDTCYDVVDIPNTADAHLIAAAPELLEALEGLVGELARQFPAMALDNCPATRKARAAIARAKGGE